jgi:hypothetical protein
MSNLPIANPVNVSSDANVNAFYSGYYNQSLPVSGQEYDIVLTFFIKRCNGDRTAAEALTSSVLVLAINRGISPISIIDDFKKIKDNQNFKAALVALLNADRRSTSKLGYASTPEPNPYVLRNIHG